MTDTDPTPLTKQALARLQKLAAGNGLLPDSIKLLGTEEKTYTILGTILMAPICETQSVRYVGGVTGRDRQIFPNTATLHEEVERRHKEFKDRPEWIAAATAQIKQQPGQGWGLDGIKMALPTLSAVLAATQPCTACNGRKMTMCAQCQGNGAITCTHCHGQRQEFCYNCLGRGTDPLDQTKPCIICNGLRYIPCRFCRASGHMVCAACQGKRGITCTACKGVGQVTEEISINCGADISFRLKGEDMPSGLRRGLDRIGGTKLADGFADIEVVTPPPIYDPKEVFPYNPPERIEDPNDIHREGPPGAATGREKPPPEIYYQAVLPYADMRIDFNGKKALVNVFGKRAALMSVPPFLDTSLNPWREKLRKATKGEAPLDDALAARAIKEALHLHVTGKSDVKEFRRVYPHGLSPDAMKEIFANITLAVHRETRVARIVTAFVAALIAATLLAILFYTELHANLLKDLTRGEGLLFDILLPLISMGLGWLAVSITTKWKLQKRFPDRKLPLLQKTGLAGYILPAAIGLAYLAIAVLAPSKPLWFLYLTHR